MKSPTKIGENRILGNISTSSIRNSLPKSTIYAKQKPIRKSETNSFISNDENAPPPCDPNIQSTKKSPHKVFPATTQIHPQKPNQFEVKRVLSTRANEITEEDDDPLGHQIRELKDELIRAKSDDGSNKSGYFARESLSQLRMSLVMSCGEDKEDSDKEDDDDVMDLSKHIDKFQTCSDDLRDSIQSSFASASGCEADSIMSGDEICSEDVENKHKDCALGNGISISLPPHQKLILEEPILSESPKIRTSRKSVASMCKKKPLSPTDSLAASLQRGLQIIDCHQQQRSSSLSNTSSVSFSFGHLSLKPCDEADNNLGSSVKLLPKEEGGSSSILLCLSCRQKLDQEEACSNEKHLQNMCIEQANKIEQLTSLLDQYEKNNVKESSKLMKSDDETELVKETYEISEKEALLKEIAELKSKLQPTDTMRSSLLLRSFQMRKSNDHTNNNVIEEERERWTEMESEWISLTDDLRMDIESHRRHAEDLETELRKEKMVTEELNDALGRAMVGHSRFIEQYTELQEKYDELAERHHVTMAGIVDVKKAAALAATKGRHGKRFAKAFSAELTKIRAEKEKEREFLKKENKSLKIQLRDTVEAVQAAGELLVRLRETEHSVQSSEERFRIVEEENEKLKNEMEKLKSKHKTEMSTIKQYLVESKLPGSALEPWFKETEPEEEEQGRTGVVSYDDDQAWRVEFGAIYQDHHDHY